MSGGAKGESSGGRGPIGPRWQDHGLSVSFRACELRSLEDVGEALRTAGGEHEPGVTPLEVSHLDLAENELEEVDGVVAFISLISLDLAHNNIVAAPPGLANTLLHLNLGYNRLEDAGPLGTLTSLVELNLGYNLVTSLTPLANLAQLQVLLVAGNRIDTLDGLAPLKFLELLDLRHNYISQVEEVRLLALNSRLRTLSLSGNPVTRLDSFRAAVVATLPGLLVLDGQKTPRSCVTRQSAVSSGVAAPSLGAQTSAGGASGGLYGDANGGNIPSVASRTELARSTGTSYGGLRDLSSLYARNRSSQGSASTPILVRQSGTQKQATKSSGQSAGSGQRGAGTGLTQSTRRTPTRKPPLDAQLRRSPAAASMIFGPSSSAGGAPTAIRPRTVSPEMQSARGTGTCCSGGDGRIIAPLSRSETNWDWRGSPDRCAPAQGLRSDLTEMLKMAIASKQEILRQLSGGGGSAQLVQLIAPPETPPVPQRLVYPDVSAMPSIGKPAAPASGALLSAAAAGQYIVAPATEMCQEGTASWTNAAPLGGAPWALDSANTMNALPSVPEVAVVAPVGYTAQPAESVVPGSCNHSPSPTTHTAATAYIPGGVSGSVDASRNGHPAPGHVVCSSSRTQSPPRAVGVSKNGSSCNCANASIGRTMDADLRARQEAFIPREGPATLLSSLTKLSSEPLSRRR